MSKNNKKAVNSRVHASVDVRTPFGVSGTGSAGGDPFHTTIIILALAVLLLIGFVFYYAMQVVKDVKTGDRAPATEPALAAR